MRHTLARCGVLGCLVLGAVPALADGRSRDNPAGLRAHARAVAARGMEFFDAERWQEAYDQLRQADESYHVPTMTLYMARCLRHLGRLVEARRLYQDLLIEPLAKDAPELFARAHKSAREDLDLLETTIPWIQVVVTGAPYEAAAVHLDGAPLPEGRREVNPGTHTIETRTAGGEQVVKTFTLAEGGGQRVALTLRNERRPPDWRASYWPAGVAFGVGASGFGLGAVTGTISLVKVADVRSRCNRVCLDADRSKRDAAHTLGIVSTAGFAVGGVGAAAGVGLLWLRRRSLKERPETGPAQWTIGVGPGGVEVRGRF